MRPANHHRSKLHRRTRSPIKRPSPCHVQRMINQWPHSLQETHRVRQRRVFIECRFVDPTRVDIKQPRVADGTMRLDRQTSLFFARWSYDLAKRRRQGVRLTLVSMEPGEDEQLHRGAAASPATPPSPFAAAHTAEFRRARNRRSRPPYRSGRSPAPFPSLHLSGE